MVRGNARANPWPTAIADGLGVRDIFSPRRNLWVWNVRVGRSRVGGNSYLSRVAVTFVGTELRCDYGAEIAMKLNSLFKAQGVRSNVTPRIEIGFFLLAILSIATTSVAAVFRVRHINPAILQDEWIYSFASKNIGLWEQDPPYDFGNYFFNFVYSSTALCGDTFYQCAKYLNGGFYFFFLLVMLGIALRYLPRWASLLSVVSIGMSPISAYVSMFLPETMYFAFLALSFYLLIQAIDSDSLRSWAWV